MFILDVDFPSEGPCTKGFYKYGSYAIRVIWLTCNSLVYPKMEWGLHNPEITSC